MIRGPILGAPHERALILTIPLAYARPMWPYPVHIALRYLHPNAAGDKSYGVNFWMGNRPLWSSFCLSGAGREACKHDWQGRFAKCDGKSRQFYTGDNNQALVLPRQPFGICCSKIDDRAHDGDWFIVQPPDTETTDFNQSCKRLRGSHQEPPVTGFQLRPVVRNQACKADAPVRASLHQRQGEPRFSGSRRAADQHGVCADKNCRSVNCRFHC